MKFFSKCQSCSRKAFIVRKYNFKTRHAGLITSKSLLCRKCAKDIKEMLGEELLK